MQSCIQPCLFCDAESECSCAVRARKPRSRSAPKESLAAERRRAVAQFVAEIEGRLFRAETDVTFDLADWEKIQRALIPAGRQDPASGKVRISEERWEKICDLLLLMEHRKIAARRERGEAPNPKHGPDRYLLHHEFDFGQYQQLLRLVLPEMFSRPAPAAPTTVSPITEAQRALKVRVMAERYERGEAVCHPDDPTVRGAAEPLPDWLAYLPSTGQIVGQGYAEKAAAEEARPKGRLTLEGCCDGPEREYDFQESLKQKPEECGIAARVCRVHAE